MNQNNIFFKNWKEIIFLIFIYSIFKIPINSIVFKFANIVHTLQHVYAAQGIFKNLLINTDIANTLMTPSNLGLIFTPGIFYLSSILNGLTNIIIFTHFLNIVFIILFYILIRKVSSVQLSIIFTTGIIFLSFNIKFFGADYVVQPLMAGILLLFFNNREANNIQLIIIGFLCGLIFIFKQNFGIFFLVVIGTAIFFKNLSIGKKFNYFSNFIILIYFLFGILFLLRTNFIFNYIYYLLPYFLFWSFILFLTNSSLYLNNKRYIYKSFLLLLGFSILPVFVIISFGSVIGYEKYLFSIFGMGWDYVSFWEYSILKLINGLNYRDRNEIFISLTVLFPVFFPFMINLLTTFKLFYLKKNIIEYREHLAICSVGIISIFLLFPFEDFRISNTKIFIYLFIFAYFFSYIKFYLKFYLLTSLFIFFIFLQSYYNAIKFFDIKKNSDLIINSNFKNKVDLKVETNLANKLNSINLFISENTNNNTFYLISGDSNMIPFLLLNKNNKNQYYTRQDKIFMNEPLVNFIIKDLSDIQYILSTQKEYDKFLNNKNNYHDNEKNFFKLFQYVNNNYDFFKEYKTSKSEFSNLIIFKKK